MKNNHHNDSATIKTKCNTSKHGGTNKQNNIKENKNKETEEESQSILAQKSKLREVTCY